MGGESLSSAFLYFFNSEFGAFFSATCGESLLLLPNLHLIQIFSDIFGPPIPIKQKEFTCRTFNYFLKKAEKDGK